MFSGGLDSFYLLQVLRPKRVAHFIVNFRQTLLALRALSALDPEVVLYDHRPFLKAVSAELAKHQMGEYLCLACKRGMVLRASQHGVPIMGDSLGQVASQTLQNAAFVSRGVKVLRPLFGSDKEDLGVEDPLAQAGSAVQCPFKPEPVATKPPRGAKARALEFIIRKNLHLSRRVAVRRASELTALG
ncbi:thiamine biosynthesis protein [Ignicoccus hospitalis KIN4/I]|uniref:Thiamine biosynthesis protein n=1 Tax=Ignicoccus hospitalis (strain KIN4/I / DSM 18386 / JCM 14125) TaxID=453591 RepID=A8A9J3_IGNH4|nr:thiamine biosynthesis protein [Ignicoccus hospitalis KIN4/I]